MKDYEKQIGKILDSRRVEIKYNSEWLGNLSAKELINLSMIFTVQQMIQRRNFKERWDSGKPIRFHELNYPLLQGYDSVAVRADVEIGGFDQLFNVLSGREIQKHFGQEPQDIIVLKMLPGLDGRKMSTSWGNIITIIDKPQDMYGKIMSMKDELISQYFELCTFLSIEEIKQIKDNLAEKIVNPMNVKARLAREVVSIYHGEKEADRAGREFEKIFRNKEVPTEIEEIKINEEKINILDLLVKVKFVFSKSEAKRLVLGNAVKIDGEVESNWQKEIQIKKGMIIQVGKRKFVKIIS